MDLLDQIAGSSGAVSTPPNALSFQATEAPARTPEELAARNYLASRTTFGPKYAVEPGPSLHTALQNAIGREVESAKLTQPEYNALLETPVGTAVASAIDTASGLPVGATKRTLSKIGAPIERGVANIAGGLENPENLLFGAIGTPELQFLAKPIATLLAGQGVVGEAQAAKDFIQGKTAQGTEEAISSAPNILFGLAGWRAKPTTIESEAPNATQTRIESGRATGKLPRVPPRQNIPAHAEEIRQGESQRTTGGGGVEPSPKVEAGAAPQQNVQPGVSPDIQKFSDIFTGKATGPKIDTPLAINYGLKAQSISDLDALAGLRRDATAKGQQLLEAYQKETDPIKKQQLLESRFASMTAQIPREAIEVATNSGGHVEGEGGIPTQYGPRPLNWKTHPEVADWLRKNGKALGISLPDELLKPKTEPTVLEPEPQVESVTPLEPQSGSPIVGMGGAKRGEPAVTVKGTPDVYGTRQATRESRAAAGKTTAVEPGKGISTPDSLEKGRQIIAQNPTAAETALSNFENDSNHAVSANAIAATRAHGEQLQLIANRAEEKYGTDSDEYRNAWQRMADWDARTKPMQTEWHKAGMAQQGETDIDTGSLTGLRRAFNQETGTDLTPEQQKRAKKIAKTSKKANDAEADARKAVNDAITRNATEIARQATKERVAKADLPTYLWSKAKSYIEAGVDDFDDLRNKLATDLGMKVEDVTAALGKSKHVKTLADDLWEKQQIARQFRQQAKRWLIQRAIPNYQKAMQSVPRILFGLKVGFHGTVALGSHAPTVLGQPRFWKAYVTDFGKMYKMVGFPTKGGQRAGRLYYEMQIQDLMRRPNYITARRAGLVNDPFQYEDYNSPDTTKYFNQLTSMGNRGYTVLKILRQDMFDQYWNKLPESSKIGPFAKAIADGVNHATGVVKGRAPRGSNIALFAPRLEASRVAWLAVDPIKAADTFLRWDKATPEQKFFAVMQLKEKAWVIGTLYGLLALNQGFLASTGSKQKINGIPESMGGAGFDPMRSDFLKFKAAGMDLAYGNAMLSMARLPVRLYQIRESSGGKLRSVVFPDESSYSVLGEYGRSQLSPFASLASTLWFKSDWQNRPLPSSDRPVPKRLRMQGIAPYTWPEFWSEQVLPIPAEEAAREVWKTGLGMSPEEIKAMRQAMATIAIMAGTGARLTTDVRGNENTQSAKVTQ